MFRGLLCFLVFFGIVLLKLILFIGFIFVFWKYKIDGYGVFGFELMSGVFFLLFCCLYGFFCEKWIFNYEYLFKMLDDMLCIFKIL